MYKALQNGEIDTIPVVEVNWEHGLVMGGTHEVEKTSGEENTISN